MPHEAAVDYSLPVNTYKGDWTYTPSNRSVLLASIGRSWYKSRGPALQRSAVDLRRRDPALGRRDGQLGRHRRRRRAGRQLEPALAVRRQLHLLPPALPLRRARASRSAARSPASGTSASRSCAAKAAAAPGRTTGSTSPTARRSRCCSTTRRSRARTTSTIRAASSATTGESAIASRSTSACASSATTSSCRSSRSRPARSPPPADYRARSTSTTGGRSSPRIGLSYALTADNRTVVKATYGRFNHAIRPSNTPDPPQPQRERIRSHALSLGRSEQRRLPAVSDRARRLHPDRGWIDHAWHLQPRHRTAANRRGDAALRASAGLAAVGPHRLRLQEGVQPLPAGERRASLRASTTSRSPSSILARTASAGNGGRRRPAHLLRLRPGLPWAGRSNATSPSTSRGMTNRYHNIEVGVDKRMADRLAAAGVVSGDEERRLDRRRARRRPTTSSSRRTRPGIRPSAPPAATSARWGMHGVDGVRVSERHRAGARRRCSAPACGS